MVQRVVVAEAVVVDDPALRDLLDDSEIERAGRKRSPVPFVSAHSLVRRTLAELLDEDPTSLRFARSCPTCGSDRHGKPRIVGRPDWTFSLSYTDEVAVVAAARGPDLGVDVERTPEADFRGFARVTLAPEEEDGFAALAGPDLLVARAQVWARKEAILKATGHGLVVDPTEVVVSGPTERARLLDWRATEPGPDDVGVVDVPLRAPEHRAAVAVLTAADVEVAGLDGP